MMNIQDTGYNYKIQSRPAPPYAGRFCMLSKANLVIVSGIFLNSQ